MPPGGRGRGRGDKGDKGDKGRDAKKKAAVPVPKKEVTVRRSPRKTKKDECGESDSAQSEVQVPQGITIETTEAELDELEAQKKKTVGDESPKPRKKTKLSPAEKEAEEKERQQILVRLAEWYSTRPQFYNKSHKDYSNKALREEELKTLSDEIGWDGE